MSNPAPKPCYVYLICSEIDSGLRGPCKVGISDSPEKRLKQVQTGSPTRLVIAFAFRVWNRRFAQIVEASFHAAHEENRLVGEWFDLSAKDTLRGLVEVFKLGIEWVLDGSSDPEMTFDSLARACNLMEAAVLLHDIYEANGELLTQTHLHEVVH
jgi:hypothetical protein